MGNGWITRSVLASIARRWSRAWDVGKSEVDRLTGCSSDDSAPHHFRKQTSTRGNLASDQAVWWRSRRPPGTTSFRSKIKFCNSGHTTMNLVSN
jgi:hypothetical protein